MKTMLRRFLPVIVTVLLVLLLFCGLLWHFVIGPNCMLSAIERGDVRRIGLLGHLGVNPNSDVWMVGGLMHCASEAGKVGAMAKLQELGANVNRLDGYGGTPADAAVEGDQVRALRWLLAHGADPTITNRDGYTVAEYITNQIGMSEAQKKEFLSLVKAAEILSRRPQNQPTAHSKIALAPSWGVYGDSVPRQNWISHQTPSHCHRQPFGAQDE